MRSLINFVSKRRGATLRLTNLAVLIQPAQSHAGFVHSYRLPACCCNHHYLHHHRHCYPRRCPHHHQKGSFGAIPTLLAICLAICMLSFQANTSVSHAGYSDKFACCSWAMLYCMHQMFSCLTWARENFGPLGLAWI